MGHQSRGCQIVFFCLCLLGLTATQSTSTSTTTPTTTNLTTTTVVVTQTPAPGSTEGPTLFEKSKSFGRLCETDNDEVGNKLGCNCKLVKVNYMIADCSSLSPPVGSPSDIVSLPAKLNVSSQVRRLDLSSNLIERIDESTFNEVDGVTELSLAHNKLTYIDYLNFPGLRELDLSFNQITNLSASIFKNCGKLLRLDLSHNNLTFIDIQTFIPLAYLQVLKLGYNPLESTKNDMEEYPFMLNNLTQLEELDLSNGSITDLPGYVLEGSPNLKKLILKNNLFSYLPTDAFAHLSALEELDLSGNFFTHLPPDGFAGLRNLRTLTIDKIVGLERIEDYAFSDLSSLKTLSCQKNYRLHEISVMAFRANPATNTLECSPKVVQLAHNNLNHFEFPLLIWSTLEELELDGNPWICDCNLQWVSEFSNRDSANATMFIDSNFKCTSPPLLAGTPVVAVAPDEMTCDSPVAMMAGIIAIVIFCFLMIFFCVVMVLHQYNLLPDWCEKFLGVLGDRGAFPKYSRVQPKPNGIRHHRLANHRSPEIPPDLEWDGSDIGHY